MQKMAAVTKEHIIQAFKELGVEQADCVLIHSSLRSFGNVEGGPMSVIQAAKDVVTEQGTVIFPTLVQRDFLNAYQHWDIDESPSDVGVITETFRLLPDSFRSDQATHSVAAWGSKAVEITSEHSAYGPRMGVFGDYCFSYSSPWQKMYMNQAKVIFIGIDMVYNTFKHFVEYALMEYYYNGMSDWGKKCIAMSQIARHGVPGVWPFHDAQKTQAILNEKGYITNTTCGNSLLTCIRADQYVDQVLQLFKEHPEQWFGEDVIAWMEYCKAN